MPQRGFPGGLVPAAALPRGRGEYLDALPPAWPSSVMSPIPGVLME